MPEKASSQAYPLLQPGDHWRTIGGNRILIHESEGQDQQAQTSPSPRRTCMDDQSDWEKSAEQTHISPSLGTVHDLGLIVFGETQSYTDRPDSNEPIDVARQKLAHSILNADEKGGFQRSRYAKTHGAIEPHDSALQNRDVCAAYKSSMKAAREAYLSGDDSTNGAVFAIQMPTPDRSNYKFQGRGARPAGIPVSTQSGPYNNSYTSGKMGSERAWLNTYWDK